MQANPEKKIKAIAVDKKTHDKQPVFNIGNINITCEDSVQDFV